MFLPAKIDISKKSLIIGSSAVVGVGIIYFTANYLFGIKSQIIRNAEKYLHVRELRTNGINNFEFSDKKFQSDMRNVGWEHGLAWCAFFVKLVFLKTFSGEKREILTKLISGSSQRTLKNFKQAENNHLWFNVSTIPRRGSIAVWQSQENKAYGHLAIVTSVDFWGFKTIEGNHTTSHKEGVRRGTHTFAEFKKTKGNKLIAFINF